MTIKRIPQRQLELGDAGFFEVRPEDPPANQVTVRAGSVHRGGVDILQNALFPADQPTVGFAVVTATFRRFDLVAVDQSGSAVIVAGYELAAAAPEFEGAPGWTGISPGIQIPDGLIPIAYVRVDEAATVLVADADITPVGGIYNISRTYDGYLVDKGFFGSAPAGASDDVSALFAADTRIGPTGATIPDSGGTSTQTGVVTSAPNNYVHVLDENGDEIIHLATGARMFGRLTEAAGTWTLTYLYVDAVGAETSMDPSTDATLVPTDIRLVGVPRVYSRNDPARPLFDSNVARLSDQLVGDIPLATEVAPGKVELATSAETTAGLAVQASDTRLGTIEGEDAGTPVANSPFDTVNFTGGGATITDGGVSASGGRQLDVDIPPLVITNEATIFSADVGSGAAQGSFTLDFVFGFSPILFATPFLATTTKSDQQGFANDDQAEITGIALNTPSPGTVRINYTTAASSGNYDPRLVFGVSAIG